jgi:hypothetical protein
VISDATLGAAVDRGILTAAQVEQLLALERASAPRTEPQDDEKLRFISGFGDVFVTMGLALFLGALGYFINQAGGPTIMWAGLAVAAWALAEFFTRRRRMALPSIVLLLVFAFASFAASASILSMVAPIGPTASSYMWRELWMNWFIVDAARPVPVALAGLLTALLVAAHYWRFRVPITVAAGVAAIVAALLIAAYAVSPEIAAKLFSYLILTSGVLIFALAMRFDMSDPLRLTRRTDIAFWLHLLAAPMIVHSLISSLVQARSLDVGSAVIILAIFLGLGFVALLVDRRAMLVSGLGYAGYAFGALIRQTGLSNETVPLTLLVLGAFVLLLSAGWRPLRGALTKLLPQDLVRRLPHPATISTA